MKLYIGRTIAGILLVTVAVLLLLEATRTTELWKPAWTLLFASSGLALLGLFAVNRSEAWATIPGFGLLGLSGSSGIHYLAPSLAETWSGAMFLGGIGLGFFAWYAARRNDWGMIIPAGGFLTLSLTSLLSRVFRGFDTGGVLFLGLALTFLAVYLLSAPKAGAGQEHRRTWALVTAIPLFVLALIILTARSQLSIDA